MTHKVDFRAFDLGKQERFFIEAKGFQDKKWLKVHKWWISHGPGPLHIYSGTWNRPSLIEIVIPKANLVALKKHKA